MIFIWVCVYALAKDGGAVGSDGLSSFFMQYCIVFFIRSSTYPAKINKMQDKPVNNIVVTNYKSWELELA